GRSPACPPPGKRQGSECDESIRTGELDMVRYVIPSGAVSYVYRRSRTGTCEAHARRTAEIPSRGRTSVCQPPNPHRQSQLGQYKNPPRFAARRPGRSPLLVQLARRGGAGAGAGGGPLLGAAGHLKSAPLAGQAQQADAPAVGELDDGGLGRGDAPGEDRREGLGLRQVAELLG